MPILTLAVFRPDTIERDLELYSMFADCPRGAVDFTCMFDWSEKSKLSNTAEFGCDSTSVTI